MNDMVSDEKIVIEPRSMSDSVASSEEDHTVDDTQSEQAYCDKCGWVDYFQYDDKQCCIECHRYIGRS